MLIAVARRHGQQLQIGYQSEGRRQQAESERIWCSRSREQNAAKDLVSQEKVGKRRNEKSSRNPSGPTDSCSQAMTGLERKDLIEDEDDGERDRRLLAEETKEEENQRRHQQPRIPPFIVFQKNEKRCQHEQTHQGIGDSGNPRD